jgi:hypothetical protein
MTYSKTTLDRVNAQWINSVTNYFPRGAVTKIDVEVQPYDAGNDHIGARYRVHFSDGSSKSVESRVNMTMSGKDVAT